MNTVVAVGEVGVAFVELQGAGRLWSAGWVVLVVGVERVQVLVAVLQSALLFNVPGPEVGRAQCRRRDGQTVSPRLHF